MDIACYLPDELGARAKAAGLGFSGLLREAVINELARMEAMKKTLKNPQSFDLDLESDDGHYYIDRITGTLLGSSGALSVYLTEPNMAEGNPRWMDDARVIIHDEHRCQYWVSDDPEEDFRGIFDPQTYIEVMSALGLKAIIDLSDPGERRAWSAS